MACAMLTIHALAFSGPAVSAGRRSSALGRTPTASSRVSASLEPARRELLATSGAALAASLVAMPTPSGAFDLFGASKKSAWTRVDLPVDSILFDIEFDSKQPDRGWIVGNKGTRAWARGACIGLATLCLMPRQPLRMPLLALTLCALHASARARPLCLARVSLLPLAHLSSVGCAVRAGTFLETRDGGKRWEQKAFANLDAEDEINYRFTKVRPSRLLPASACLCSCAPFPPWPPLRAPPAHLCRHRPARSLARLTPVLVRLPPRRSRSRTARAG